MTTILAMLAISLSMMFLFMNHPLSFGLILMIETAIIALMTGMMSLNFWFSYILFLIMVGGMLILFIYMTSVASNEKFKLSYTTTIIMVTAMITTSLIVITIDSFLSVMMVFNQDLVNSMKSNSFSMSKYINSPSNNIMFMMISYLLITLIMVVKITNIKYGPMRQKF